MIAPIFNVSRDNLGHYEMLMSWQTDQANGPWRSGAAIIRHAFANIPTVQSFDAYCVPFGHSTGILSPGVCFFDISQNGLWSIGGTLMFPDYVAGSSPASYFCWTGAAIAVTSGPASAVYISGLLPSSMWLRTTSFTASYYLPGSRWMTVCPSATLGSVTAAFVDGFALILQGRT